MSARDPLRRGSPQSVGLSVGISASILLGGLLYRRGRLLGLAAGVLAGIALGAVAARLLAAHLRRKG